MALIAMRGGIASGKSTLAGEVAQRLDVPLVSADGVRSALGLDASFGDPRHEVGRPGERHADPPAEIYAEVLRRAERLLRAGWGVVLDGCFGSRAQRGGARDLARRHRIPFLLVECRVPHAVRRERLAARDRRDGLPEGSWLELARSFESELDDVVELSSAEYLVVDGSAAPGELIETLIRPRLTSLLAGGPAASPGPGHSVPEAVSHPEVGSA